MFFPEKAHYKLFNLFFFNYKKHLTKKYFLNLEIDIKPKYFIDCGAFIGGVTLSALDKYKSLEKVIAIEPSPLTFSCLQKNLPQKVISLQKALSQEKGILKLYLSKTHTDNSLSEKTENSNGKSIPVEAITLKDIFHDYQIDPDFTLLKVEAEGFENEVILGLDEISPKYIVIDISPEREGESCFSDINNLLKDKYIINHNNKTATAIRKL
ncbi:FkbM family methyltransferase [Vibrio salinus]|uniref:FkbM family methyltransferase n=1 Tax=Vibrio salinus TaxID=2899784 RepID=UPI001E620763|nr:FkbM family methyltransferase [Vibrio salinus]MCE0493803.1 FkbM family methyltransferase [Vibrio salinus]